MSPFFHRFFESNEYFIDEKLQFFKFANAYKIYDALGLEMGAVTQQLSTGHKILRLLMKRAMLPFQLVLTDVDGQPLARIRRGWTFWLSQITIQDGKGETTGYIRQKFRFLKPRFQIFDAQGTPIAEINGDWKAWVFTITDAGGNTIGTINKKWGGVAREFFTSADKYHVSIMPGYAGDKNKINIVATAVTIDMVLKESQ